VALRAEGLSKSWGVFLANDAVTLTLEAGERHALIGPNGAGKTTFVNLLTGLYRPSSGDVYLGAEPVTALSQYRRVQRGITRTFQINSLFGGLTVLESVLVAICQRRGRGASGTAPWGGSRRRLLSGDQPGVFIDPWPP
jgi:branched-chain amino acid transport system ATP-binding protein